MEARHNAEAIAYKFILDQNRNVEAPNESGDEQD